MEGFSAITNTTSLLESEVVDMDSTEGDVVEDDTAILEEIADVESGEETAEETAEEVDEEDDVSDEDADGAIEILKTMYLEIKKLYKQLTGKEFDPSEMDASDSAIMESQLTGENLMKLTKLISNKANFLESITPDDANAMSPEEARMKLDELSKIVFRMIKSGTVSQSEGDNYLKSISLPLIKRIQGNQA